MKKIILSLTLLVILVTLLVGCNTVSSNKSEAKTYPSRPIELIVPWAPGGVTDVAARAIAGVIPQYIGQPVLVVNKPGGGGADGSFEVAKAKPDGYTILMGSIGANTVAPATNPKLGYKYNDFTPIAVTSINPMLVVVRKDAPWNKLEEFINYIKEHPGKVKYYYSPGIDTFAPAMLMKAAGIDRKNVVGVSFESGAPGALAIIQGTVDFGVGNAPAVMPHIQGGRLKALAVTTPERLKQLPDVPTLKELGYGDAAVMGWRGILGPAGLPEDVVKKWETALENLTKDKSYIQLVENMGDIPYYLNPKETAQFLENEFNRYRQFGEELGLIIK